MKTEPIEPDVRLRRAAAGEESAFEAVVREHQAMVYSIAWHYLHDRASAEELAQEVFLHLHRNIESIESPAHLLHWLRRVACHRAIDQSRRLKFRPRAGLDSAPEPVSIAHYRDPMLKRLLERLLGTLPERSRMIVVLRYQEDMEPTEIAGVLEMPVGTVKSSLHRALAVLRGRFERAERAPKGVSK
ncbi:MAG: RNA polymerase sigma factor [Bryobacteraceae bacterium]